MNDRRSAPRHLNRYDQTIFLDTIRIVTVAGARQWMRRIEEALSDAPEARDLSPDLAERALAATRAVAALDEAHDAEPVSHAVFDAIDMYRRAAAYGVTRARQTRREAAAKGAA